MPDLASVANRRFTGICISQTPARWSHHRTGDITIPIRQLLSESQRRQLLEPHFNMGQREIARYYTLSDDDLKRIRRHRRDHNRLGYAVQLGLLRYPGWPFRPAEAVPVPMITYIAAQLGVGPKLIKEYSTTRDTTRREHLAQVQREFGFTSFTAQARDELAQWLLPMALGDERAMALVSGLLDEMGTRKIVLPALSTVEGIVVDTLALAEAITFETLCRSLSETQRERLDFLISPAGDDNRTLTWFRYPPGRPTPANFLRLIDRLQGIREMQIPDDGAWRVHQNRLRRLAREGASYTVQHIHRFRPEKRHALLVALRRHRLPSKGALPYSQKAAGGSSRP